MLNISIEEAVRLLCKFGFMNGWLGDTSPEFQAEEVAMIRSFTRGEQMEWLSRHAFNLRVYCNLDPMLEHGIDIH